MSSASDVELQGVVKRFDDAVAVDGISVEIPSGSFFALLGPSGCGKTTTLRMIGGFEEPDEGAILLGGKDVVGLPPYKRDVNTVFQSYALFPHLTIFENVAFGLRRKGVDGDHVKRQVDEMLELVGLTGLGAPPAAPALRRPAAARRARPRARQPAAGAAARRAARRARPEAAQADAARAQADPARDRHHLRPRHARPGGGDDDGRHDRGHEPRPDRAARLADRALRAAGDGLRRQLPRRLEPAARHDHGAGSRPHRDGRRAARPARRPHRRRSRSASAPRRSASARRARARTRSPARSRRPPTSASRPSTSSPPAPASSSSTRRTPTGGSPLAPGSPWRCSAGAPSPRSSSTLKSLRRRHHESPTDPSSSCSSAPRSAVQR